MAKVKTPVLSLGASGSIAETITLQRQRRLYIARRKPVPRYTRTLPQLYQRWDYQDGIAYWNTLSSDTKQSYQSLGSRHHMTGFAYFMRYYLRNLPDLKGRWRLDEPTGAVAHDSSKNTNTGTLTGTSFIPGIIDGARYFDGLNDVIPCGNDESLNVGFSDFSIEAFNYQSAQNEGCIFSKRVGGNDRWFLRRRPLFTDYLFYVVTGGVLRLLAAYVPVPFNLNTWEHIMVAVDRDVGVYWFLNGVAVQFDASDTSAINFDNAGNFYIGWKPFHKGGVDHVSLYNRCLSTADALRHAQRRYPA